MLGLLAADFPAWNLAALLGTDADDAEQLLEQLVDAVLVDVAGVDATGLIRYRLHDLLRAFARECLAEAEPPDVRDESLARLADQYIGAARLASALVHPGTPESRAAPAAAAPGRGRRARRPVGLVHGRTSQPRSAGRAGSRRAAVGPDLAARRAAAGHVRLAGRLALLGTHPPAGPRRRPPGGETRTPRPGSCGAWAPCTASSAATTKPSPCSRRRRRSSTSHGDRHRWAAVLRNLGDTYRYQGRLAEAIETFSAGLAVFRSAADTRSEAGALNGMADAHRGLSQWDEARSAFQACIGIYHDLADRLEEARARIRYALVFRDQYLSEQAIPLLDGRAAGRQGAR